MMPDFTSGYITEDSLKMARQQWKQNIMPNENNKHNKAKEFTSIHVSITPRFIFLREETITIH